MALIDKETKSNLSYLFVSVGTLLFYISVIPLADALSTHIANRFNVANAKLQAKVNKILPQEESCNTQAIGFQISQEEEE